MSLDPRAVPTAGPVSGPSQPPRALGHRRGRAVPSETVRCHPYSLMTALTHGMPLALTERFHVSTFWSDAPDLGVR